MSRMSEISRNQDIVFFFCLCILNSKDVTRLETYEKIYILGAATPGGDKNLARLASFYLQFYGITCKPAIRYVLK